MAARAAIIVTGTEVLTGRVSDRNGPWLAEQLRLIGVDIAETVIVGDRVEDLRFALTALSEQGLDLILTSGGLGPTADDLTAATVGDLQGRGSVIDHGLERDIAAIVERFSTVRGWALDPAETAASVSKQALVPVGAHVLAPVGTAPGLVVPAGEGRSGPPVVVLPGPPRELQGMWPSVLADSFVQVALAGAVAINQRTIRFWGTSESEIAATLRRAESDLDGLEITTCLRSGELEVVTRFFPEYTASYDRLESQLADEYASTLYSIDGRTVEQIVADTLTADGLTVATAESCTAGLVAGRLTDLAGSSAYVLGGLVVYSNEAKTALAEVPAELIAEHGAVSPEVALALADGARARLGSDYGIGVTGIAGPGGATEGKPVGLVYLCVSSPSGSLPRRVVLPGSRADVRNRTVVEALQMLRQALSG